MLELNAVHQGDCLELMSGIPDGSVDMILCDLPYGTTACKWDSIIPLSALWAEYRRIVKLKSAIVLTASQPFTTVLAHSNLDNFHYSWVWNKKFAGNFVQAKRMPLRNHEDILVFSYGGGLPNYFPQKTQRARPITKGSNKQSEALPIAVTQHSKEFGDSKKVYVDKFPETILEFSCRDAYRGLHPTQKPVALCEYLIKTYSKEGAVVLDNCAGSGTVGVACQNTKRNFILIEREQKYVEICKSRLTPTPQ